MTSRQTLLETTSHQAAKALQRQMVSDLKSGHLSNDWDALYEFVHNGRARKFVEELLSEKTDEEWGVEITTRFLSQAAKLAEQKAHDRVRDLEMKAKFGIGR